MSKIESVKTYAGKDLETIFFRPMLTGPNAEELGIKVMYNMPVPTTLHFWKRSGDILQKFNSAGWSGGAPADKYQKTIHLDRVKAEVGYSADDYFTMVYGLITGRPDVNLDDLTGTELEAAETALFREAVAESIRATMWLGDTSRGSGLNTFDGIVPRILADWDAGDEAMFCHNYSSVDASEVETILETIWREASPELRALKSQGNLAIFVTSDIYNAYEDSLDSAALESAYLARQEGRESLSYRGIPLVDLNLDRYLSSVESLPQSFAILTDRRNLALAVNTGDFPGTEVRMWYNPDMMENRQRAVFMAGADYLLPELISFAYIM